MKEKTLVVDFTTGSIPKQLFLFASPLFLSSLLQIAYNMVDMVVVGNVMGDIGLSAVSVGGDVSHFLTFLALGFSSAGQILIAKYIGAGQKEKVGRFIATMFVFLTVIALALSVVCFALRRPILLLMNTPAEAFDQALGYSSVCIAGLVFIYGYNMVSAVLRGIGDSRHPFLFISLAALLNIVLDIIFVVHCSMGAAGAALATVISQCVSFVACAVFLYRRRDSLGFAIRAQDFLHIDRDMLAALVKLGIPMAIKSASVQFSKLFVNSWINSYGVTVSAFAGIANKVNSISNLLSNALNTAGSSMVGQNIGARAYKRVPRILLTIAAATLAIASLMTLLFFTFPNQLFGIFTRDPSVLAIVPSYLPIAALIFFGSASRAPSNALINGSGNTKANFATAILDGIVLRIGLGLLFGLGLGMDYLGFWLGDALAGFTPLVIGVVFYLSGKWKES